MKYLNVFNDKSVLDSSVASFNHGDGAFVFGVKTAQGIEYVTIYDLRHPGANCVRLGSVNMEPVRLDSSSTKQDLNVGDFLYSTADEKLTLDALTNGVNNTPIAICVIPDVYENLKNGDESEEGVHTARFVSINYMNSDTPATGSEEAQPMYFGNYQVTIGNTRGGTDETSYVGGKWNTQLCLSKATNLDLNICDGVTDNPSTGYCAPACCCVAYSTPGTKPGDWYLPSIGELYQLYENKTAINEKRTAIKGSGFSDGGYWSSREYSLPLPGPSSLEDGPKSGEGSSDLEYIVDLDNGSIYDGYLKNHAAYVLAFIAVGPPEQPGRPVRPEQPAY